MIRLMRNTGELRAAVEQSVAGLRHVWEGELAFRQYCIFALVLFPISFIVGQSAAEIAVLLLSIALVLLVEILNTAIEKAVDRISTESHPLAGAAKDIASAAVFFSLLVFVVVWLTVILF